MAKSVPILLATLLFGVVHGETQDTTRVTSVFGVTGVNSVNSVTSATSERSWLKTYTPLIIFIVALIGASYAYTTYRKYFGGTTVIVDVEDPHHDKLVGENAEKNSVYQFLVNAVELVFSFIAIVLFLALMYWIVSCMKASCRPPPVVPAPPLTTQPQYIAIPKTNPDDGQDQKLLAVKNYHSQEETSDMCSICINPCKGDLSKLPCDHAFHQDCITPWLYVNQNCPLCRTDVPMV